MQEKGLSPQAEHYIGILLQKPVPYTVEIANATFHVTDTQVYGPGTLSQMFVTYLLENCLFQNSRVLDVGAGCFALGIVGAKNGAKEVLGTDISPFAIDCANNNIALNGVEATAKMLQGDGLGFLLPKYQYHFDLVLASTPWETIMEADFATISSERKVLSRAFYDINDLLITDVLTKGPTLLSPNGKIFITASKRIMDQSQGFAKRTTCPLTSPAKKTSTTMAISTLSLSLLPNHLKGNKMALRQCLPTVDHDPLPSDELLDILYYFLPDRNL